MERDIGPEQKYERREYELRPDQFRIVDPDQNPNPYPGGNGGDGYGNGGDGHGIGPFARDLVPAKVGRIARVLYNGIEELLSGRSILIARQEVKRGMQCRTYVSDSTIIYHVRDKISTALRENLYGLHDRLRGGQIKAGWDERLTIEDEDKVIYIKFRRFGDSSRELEPISSEKCVYINT